MDIVSATIGVFFGELYGNLVGGGSLVTQAVLQNILHFDIKTAMALDNAAAVGSNVGMLFVLARRYAVKWWFLLFVVLQVIGAFIGAWTLIVISPSVLKIIFVVSVIALVIKNFWTKDTKSLKEDFVPNARTLLYLSIIALCIGIYNAAFVIGDWIIALLLLTGVLSMRYQYAIFLLTSSMLVAQPFAVYQYHIHGLIDWAFLVPMFIATVIGGVISAAVLDKIHSEKLESFLRYISVLLVIYLLLGLLG